jgi:hypothetical protein
MFSSMHMSRVLESTSLGQAIDPADDAVRAGGDVDGVVARSPEKDDESAAALTLDDFGGRSDALGG